MPAPTPIPAFAPVSRPEPSPPPAGDGLLLGSDPAGGVAVLEEDVDVVSVGDAVRVVLAGPCS